MNKLLKLARSSSDAKKLSLTLKSLVPLIVGGAVLLGWNVQETDLNELITQVIVIVSALSTIVGSAGTAYGVARKIYNGRWSAE